MAGPLSFGQKRNLITGVALDIQRQNQQAQRSPIAPVQPPTSQGSQGDSGIPQGPQRVGSPVERWKNFMNAVGGGVTVTSGFRSVAEQQAIWDATPVERRGKWVARPGSSFHNKKIGGLSGAQDLAFSSPEIRNRFRELAPKFGFWQPLSYEDWHWEAIETRGMRGR